MEGELFVVDKTHTNENGLNMTTTPFSIKKLIICRKKADTEESPHGREGKISFVSVAHVGSTTKENPILKKFSFVPIFSR